MSHPAMITDAQHAHFKAFMTAYVAGHELTFSDIGRRVPGMAAGSVAGAVRQKPAYRFIQRLMAAYGWTEEELLGPPEPIPSPLAGTFIAPSPAVEVQEQLLFADTTFHGEECLLILRAILRELQDIRCLLEPHPYSIIP